MAFEKAIALTGGIATGKSTVSDIFYEYGVDIIDADHIAHAVLETQHEPIAEIFGKEYMNDGKVDRKALGTLVFKDREAKLKLEALVHPLIYREIEKRAEILDQIGKPYLVDIPLFFETRRYPIATSIVVYAPRELQLQRLMKRNGFNTEEALQRIEAQMDIEEKKKKATYIIDNSRDLHTLQSECDKIYQIIFT